MHSITDGQPPEINLKNEKNNGEAVLEIIKKDLANSVHDISSGGLIVALAEMSIGSNFGLKIYKPKKLTKLIKYLFGEDQGRYILEIDKEKLKKVEEILKNNNIFYEHAGVTQKDFLKLKTNLRLI